MKNTQNKLAAAIALTTGAAGSVGTAFAVTLTFQNNTTSTNPANTLLGFSTDSESHFATSYGIGLNDGEKDVMFGGAQWVFNGNISG